MDFNLVLEEVAQCSDYGDVSAVSAKVSQYSRYVDFVGVLLNIGLHLDRTRYDSVLHMRFNRQKCEIEMTPHHLRGRILPRTCQRQCQAARSVHAIWRWWMEPELGNIATSPAYLAITMKGSLVLATLLKIQGMALEKSWNHDKRVSQEYLSRLEHG